METPMNNTFEATESRESEIVALLKERLLEFDKLGKPHEPTQVSIERIIDSYDIDPEKYPDLIADFTHRLRALDTKEAQLLKEAQDKKAEYKRLM